MGYISNRKTRLQNQLTTIQTQIENLNTVLTEMSLSGAQSYSFDSGEGAQRTTRRSLKEIMDMLERLQATESHIINELYNMGIVAIRLRRKN
jgi:Asp-tRNA(Asn)/Glu-tRNA(Gln) amidotransferase C subunit